MNAIDWLEQKQLKTDLPQIKAGDKVKVHVKIKEGDKERIQIFEGTVLKLHRGGARASFTVRKISFGVGVERVFPMHSPVIDKIEIVARGKVRQGRIYYLRDLSGRKARIVSIDENRVKARKEAGAEQAKKSTAKKKTVKKTKKADASKAES